MEQAPFFYFLFTKPNEHFESDWCSGAKKEAQEGHIQVTWQNTTSFKKDKRNLVAMSRQPNNPSLPPCELLASDDISTENTPKHLAFIMLCTRDVTLPVLANTKSRINRH